MGWLRGLPTGAGRRTLALRMKLKAARWRGEASSRSGPIPTAAMSGVASRRLERAPRLEIVEVEMPAGARVLLDARAAASGSTSSSRLLAWASCVTQLADQGLRVIREQAPMRSL